MNSNDNNNKNNNIVEEDEACNTELQLGIGLVYSATQKKMEKKPLTCFDLFPKENDGFFEDHNPRNDDVYKPNNTGSRKKLKLTKDQFSILENHFNLNNSNLDRTTKYVLADELNLTPQQVSVWFQNRRARTKSKQPLEPEKGIGVAEFS